MAVKSPNLQVYPIATVFRLRPTLANRYRVKNDNPKP